MKRPIYRIHRRGNKYYIGNNKKPITLDNYLVKQGWVKFLSRKSKSFVKSNVKRISPTPGTYGIFVRNNRTKLGIGECLYVGQSVNIERRISEHIKLLKQARREIGKKKTIPSFDERTMSKMYYLIAKEYSLKDLKFVKLTGVEKRKWEHLDKYQAFELLAFLEQWSMDSWEPKYNILAARKTMF